MSELPHKPIHAWVWSPYDRHLFKPKASDPAECTVFYCQIPESCPLLKEGQCIHKQIFGSRCPYGYVRKEAGPTKRSKKCFEWIKQKKELHAAILGKIKGSPPYRMVEIGEYVYLPYSHADLNKDVPFLRHNLYLTVGSPYVKREAFTIEVIKSMVSFRPQALMGGEIRDYQTKIVPKFVDDLRECYPQLYYQLVDALPQYALKERNFVGRKALLFTVLPSNVDMGGDVWKWDGASLELNDPKKLLFSHIENRNGSNAIKSISIKVVPNEDAVTKILRNDQVSNETRFVD